MLVLHVSITHRIQREGIHLEGAHQLPIRVSAPSVQWRQQPTQPCRHSSHDSERTTREWNQKHPSSALLPRCFCWCAQSMNRGPCADVVQIAYTLIYVLPFYVSPTTRPSPQLARDAPSVIRGRIRLVTLSCLVCSVGSFILLSSVAGGSPLKSLHLMGYWPLGAAEAVQNLGLTAILFLGPLFEAGVAEGRWQDWIRFRGLSTSISSWIGWRNFVAVCCCSPALATTTLLIFRTRAQ